MELTPKRIRSRQLGDGCRGLRGAEMNCNERRYELEESE